MTSPPEGAENPAPRWSCVTGHDIADLQAETVEQSVDGARLRLCRQHHTVLQVVAMNTASQPISLDEMEEPAASEPGGSLPAAE